MYAGRASCLASTCGTTFCYISISGCRPILRRASIRIARQHSLPSPMEKGPLALTARCSHQPSAFQSAPLLQQSAFYSNMAISTSTASRPSHPSALRPSRSLPLVSQPGFLSAAHVQPAAASTDCLIAATDALDINGSARSAHDNPSNGSVADNDVDRDAGSTHEQPSNDAASAIDDPAPDWSAHSDFCIPESVFSRSREANRLDPKSGCWTYELFQSKAGKAPVYHYCKSRERAEEYALLFRDAKVLGFDLEWKPSSGPKSDLKSYVSTIQLASDSRVAVFHLALHSGDKPDDLVGPNLRAVLEDPSIIKAGVNIAGDVTRMAVGFNITVANAIDTSRLYRTVKYSATSPKDVNRRPVAMSEQALESFKLPISKDDDTRNSDWTRDLTKPQVVYAASDAYAGWWLYTLLHARWQAMDPCPALPQAAPAKPLDAAADAPHKKRKAPLVALPASPELDRANAWLAARAPALPAVDPRKLRAYALWHVVGLSVNAAAKKLRQPRMLAPATVAGYIVDAVISAARPPASAWLDVDDARVGELTKALGSRAGRVKWALERVALRRRIDAGMNDVSALDGAEEDGSDSDAESASDVDDDDDDESYEDDGESEDASDASSDDEEPGEPTRWHRF